MGKEIIMTREQLVAMGLTDEQIEKVIAENSKDIQSANSKADKYRSEIDKYKSDAGKLAEVQKQLEDLQNAQLSDIEKANKAVEAANQKIAELEAREKLGNSRKNAMEKFKITSEQANSVVKDDGSFDFEALGKIISEKEIAAATAKEQEIANNSSNPGGGNGNVGGKDDEKTADVKNAESITFGGVSKEAQAARDYYK